MSETVQPRTHTIAIRLDPKELTNPDTDLRIHLPDLIVERSGGVLEDDGWGYEGEPSFMVIYLTASDLDAGLRHVIDVLQNETVDGNDFKTGCVVAIRDDQIYNKFELDSDDFSGYEVVYPEGFSGIFDPHRSP